MRSTSQVLSDHLYPDSRSGYPSYVFRVCRARTITSEGSLLPPGMVGVEADLAREFPFSEEEAVLHLQKGAEEPCELQRGREESGEPAGAGRKLS